MAQINLLPIEITPKGFSVRLATILRNVATVGFIILLIAGVGIGAYFLITSTEIRTSNTKQEQYKSVVKSLESTEQSLVLLKDRVGKVKTVLGLNTVGPGIEKAGAIISTFPPGIEAKEIQIAELTKFTVSVTDTAELTKFMSAAIAANKFKKIDLRGFSFSPSGGYLISLEMTDK